VIFSFGNVIDRIYKYKGWKVTIQMDGGWIESKNPQLFAARDS